MTVELVAALCTGIVSIIVAIGTVIIGLNNKNAIKADAIKKDEQLKEIHVLVNSQMSDTLARLGEAMKEIKDLRTFIAEVIPRPVVQASAPILEKSVLSSLQNIPETVAVVPTELKISK